MAGEEDQMLEGGRTGEGSGRGSEKCRLGDEKQAAAKEAYFRGRNNSLPSFDFHQYRFPDVLTCFLVPDLISSAPLIT